MFFIYFINIINNTFLPSWEQVKTVYILGSILFICWNNFVWTIQEQWTLGTGLDCSLMWGSAMLPRRASLVSSVGSIVCRQLRACCTVCVVLHSIPRNASHGPSPLRSLLFFSFSFSLPRFNVYVISICTQNGNNRAVICFISVSVSYNQQLVCHFHNSSLPLYCVLC